MNVYFLRVFLSCFAAFNLILAGFKIYKVRSQISAAPFIVVLVLGAELVFNLLRLILFSTDPFFCATVLPNIVVKLLSQWIELWILAAAVALVFYWIDIILKIKSIEIASKTRRKKVAKVSCLFDSKIGFFEIHEKS